MNRVRIAVFSVFFASFVLLVVLGDDWPQWRGKNRDGISAETGLLQEWPEDGPKLLWQRSDLGDGYATPAVIGERIYLLSSKGMDDEFIEALEVASGKTVWSTRIGKVGANIKEANYPGARSTPTVDGDKLFALGSDGDLACLEVATGKIVWSQNLQTNFGGKLSKWAYAESPLIDGEVLVCTPGGADATLVALEKKSGTLIWKTSLPASETAAYASAIVVQAGGVKQYVQMLEKGLIGVDAKTGNMLWRYGGSVQSSPANIPTPVSRREFVYSSSGKGGGGLVRLKASGAGVEAEEVYQHKKLPTAIGGSIELNGFLYGTNGEGLLCADYATGELKWQERGVGAGSVLYADKRLYVHGEKGGAVALVEATPDAYRERGKFTPPDMPTMRKGAAWAYPVVANGRLYIRDWNCLWCYDVKAK